MKFSDNMLFAHPVLSPVSSDYQHAIFVAEFNISIEDPDWLDIETTIDLRCPDLDALLEEGDAGCGFYVVCRRTYQNRLVEVNPGQSSHKLSANLFFGTVEL